MIYKMLDYQSSPLVTTQSSSKCPIALLGTLEQGSDVMGLFYHWLKSSPFTEERMFERGSKHSSKCDGERRGVLHDSSSLCCFRWYTNTCMNYSKFIVFV